MGNSINHAAQSGESTDPTLIPYHPAHHFNDADHEFEASKEGMWIFLVTEVLMVGAIFVGYLILRALYPEAFLAAHKYLNVKMGALNTVILITSSVTMVLGVSAAQRSQRVKAMQMLALTVLLGFGFLIVKYFEYSHKFHEGIYPAGKFTFEALASVPKAPLFFSMYFMLTGVHALHVVIGMILITWVIFRLKRGEIHGGFYTPVELVGFYWHFVDLVWIYLFPLLYLLG